MKLIYMKTTLGFLAKRKIDVNIPKDKNIVERGSYYIVT